MADKNLAGVEIEFNQDEGGKLVATVAVVNLNGHTEAEHSTILDSNAPTGSQVPRAQSIKAAVQRILDRADLTELAGLLGTQGA
jgi:hypothetical protein